MRHCGNIERISSEATHTENIGVNTESEYQENTERVPETTSTAASWKAVGSKMHSKAPQVVEIVE